MQTIQCRLEVNVLTVGNMADYTALLDLVRDQYYRRLIDVLDVRAGA